jgi:CarboxypepD_reg-like domain/TonB dependent receptor/TonB-dependent Receptor Plug Domain
MPLNKYLLGCIATLLLTLGAYAQKNYTISGTIKDKKTGETLIGATVKNAANKATGTATNEYGFYSITLPQGSYKIIVEYIGYQTIEKEIVLDKKFPLDIMMEPAETELKEVTISAKQNTVKQAQMGVEKLNIKEINMLPVIFGEKDVLKTVQLLPGVQPASEGGSGFYVRGGAADQNLILLDEAVVYNPSHLLGFFSTFNSDAIKDVTMYKGTAPAQFGGRLSSVLDVKMNEGNDQEMHVSGGIGLISSKLNIEGPIKKDEGSFLITARRTYADVFLKLSSDTTINKSSLYFYDLNAKLNYKLSKTDRIFLSGYFGQDDLGLGTLFGLNWGNATATLRWNHLINDKMFSNTSLIYSNYGYGISISNSGISAQINSAIRDWNLKEELEFFANPTNSIRLGISSIYHTISPSSITGTGITSLTQPDKTSWENAVYLAESWKATSQLNIDFGLRLSAFSVLGGSNLYDLNADGSIKDTLRYSSGQIVSTFINPEPRISGSYLLTENASIKASYSRNSQYMHLISNSNASNPTDKWVSSNNNIKAEIADLVSAGYFRSLSENKYEFSVESYYKYMQNQLDYRDNANVLSNSAIEPQLLYGQGRAYGAEFLLRKKEGRLSGWIAYTLSRSEIQIDGINSNKWYPARQDRTHDLSVVAIYKLNKKWTLSSDFVFYTGNAVTFPSGKYQIGSQVYNYYTDRNAYRMPNYNRLDLSATKQLKPHKKYTSELTFSLYNAYGRENAYLIRFQTDPNDANKTQAIQIALFKWVPSISYNFKF